MAVGVKVGTLQICSHYTPRFALRCVARLSLLQIKPYKGQPTPVNMDSTRILTDSKYQRGGSLMGFAWYGHTKPTYDNPYWVMELVHRPESGWFGRTVPK